MNDLNNLNSSISKFLKEFNVRGIKQNLLVIEIWDEMVGELVSKNTNPLNFTVGIIYVEISNSAWANEMSFLKDDIIDKYNERFKKKLVKEIRFIVKRNDRNIPSIKVIPKGSSGEKNKIQEQLKVEQKLSPEDRKLIEVKSNEVEDNGLKNVLKKFFERSRKRELALLQHGWNKCSICKCLHKEKGNLCLPCRSVNKSV